MQNNYLFTDSSAEGVVNVNGSIIFGRKTLSTSFKFSNISFLTSSAKRSVTLERNAKI